MANPLFYRNVVPLNTETHRDLRISAPDAPLGFARQANLIPALLDEFVPAVGELPVAFLPGAGVPSAVFVTGLAPGSNAFVAPDGSWTGGYMPAYLRRYPFIIGEAPGQEPMLCIDDSYEGFGQKSGERFFSNDGKSAPPLTRALEFAQGYRAAAERTEAFSARLKELDLFRAVTLDATNATGARTSVHGLLVVDQEALADLPDESVLSLHRAGYLPAIHAHLLSLRAVARLVEAPTETEAPVPEAQGAA